MVKQVGYGECLEFQQAREALANNQFHAIQEMAGVKKWWAVVFKKNGELTAIIGAIPKAKAEKLAAGLNKVLGVN